MKHTLLIFLLFILTCSYSQTDLIEVPEVWEIDIWDGTNWNLSSQTNFTFNSNCQPIEGLTKFIDFDGTNMLENVSFLTITYDANNLPLESINQLWDEETNMWEDQLKTEFTHTGDFLTESINYDWLDNNWEPSNRQVNTYNASNLIIETISQTWDETNNFWLNTSKTEYTFNPNNSINIATIFDWNSSNNTWENDVRETHTYSGNVLTSKESDSWNGSTWLNDILRNYTYDSNDFLIETLKKNWDSSNFENDNRILRTNNTDGNPTEMITQTWFFGTWLNGTRDRRTYPNCESLSIEKLIKNEFNIYPNPAKNELTVNSKTTGTLTIIDTNGRLLKTLNIKNNINTLDISNINSGLYILIFQNENRKETKRLIINKFNLFNKTKNANF